MKEEELRHLLEPEIESKDLCQQILVTLAILPDPECWCQGKLWADKDGNEVGEYRLATRFSLGGALQVMGNTQFISPMPLYLYLERRVNKSREEKKEQQLPLLLWNDLPEIKHFHIRQLLKGVLKEHGVLELPTGRFKGSK